MKSHNKIIGKIGETIAIEFLHKKGFKIIEKNFISKYGEIDIICLKNDCYYFFEVKTRLNDEHIKPFESVNIVKIKKILITVKYFFYKYQKYNYDKDQKLKIISITLSNPFYTAICSINDFTRINYKELRNGQDYKIEIVDVLI